MQLTKQCIVLYLCTMIFVLLVKFEDVVLMEFPIFVNVLHPNMVALSFQHVLIQKDLHISEIKFEIMT